MKKDKKMYALKEMAKVKIIDKKSERSIKYEKELLTKLKHPFIVNMHYAFQDYNNLYVVMDLLSGGDLRYHISRYKRFTEEQTSKIINLEFFIACILLAFEYIHENNVLHRDIKPENLVLEESGYVRITDFGIAKVYQKDNSCETSGTPGYMSPEVMCGQNHTILVDYFAIGVMGYEFMYGRVLFIKYRDHM
jgi:serine/threonine protein kinase